MKKLLAIATPSMLLIALLFSFASAKQSLLPEQAQAVLLPEPLHEETRMSDSFKRRLQDSIQAYFDKAVGEKQIVGAAVSIVKCDSIIYTGGFGNKSAAITDGVDAETIFRIGSVSKGFAGILTGIHVQEGLVDWEDKIIDHIPNFRLASMATAKKVTLSHVLSHTAGLPYHSYTNLVEAGLPLDAIASRFNKVLPLQEPGSVYNYQNAIFALSGEIIERVTGKPLKDVMKEKIFDPLQMTTASASYEALQEATNVALPHQRIRRGWRTMKLNKKYYNAVAAGGVNASVTDMGKWMKFLLGNNPDVLMPKVMDQVFNPVVQVGGRRNYYQKWPGYSSSYYGLGWRVHSFMNTETERLQKVIHHGGSVNNFRSEIAIYPDDDMGICVLFNSPTKMAKDCIPKIREIIQQIINSPEEEDVSLKEALVML
ncbi:serine hydrolase [Aquimarina sp. AU474]|uniref:serine hydrolase domain-containing protein n=1 Tax=Aquimarina sp. AU474 TaxID=2108529 RepID=UPI000D697DF6|nr:serine hydrolase domain-containing protein [Aquimarina sp. AU474]